MAFVENAVIQAYGLKEKKFFVFQVLTLQIHLTTEVYMERNLILSQGIFSFICPAILYFLLPSGSLMLSSCMIIIWESWDFNILIEQLGLSRICWEK